MGEGQETPAAPSDSQPLKGWDSPGGQAWGTAGTFCDTLTDEARRMPRWSALCLQDPKRLTSWCNSFKRMIASLRRRVGERIGQLCGSMPVWLVCHGHLHSSGISLTLYSWTSAVSQHSYISLQAPMVSLISHTGLLSRANVVLATDLRFKLFVLSTNKDVVLLTESHGEV